MGESMETSLAVTPSEHNAVVPIQRDETMPSMEELRQERLRLLAQIRHHKDEQDSIALDIENQPGAGDVYRTAARVQHVEHFAHRATEYVEELLPEEIACVVTADEINSEKKIAMYIKELQRKRDMTLKRISEIQDRFDKHRDPTQWYKEAVMSKYAAKDEHDQKIVEHTLTNDEEIEKLEAENSRLRDERSAASAELIRLNRDAQRKELFLTNSLKKTELQNTVHARQCRELNVANATTTNALQVMMNQLNAEHYGAGNAPTKKKLEPRLNEAIENADQDCFLIQPKDVTKEDIERVQEKKGKKGSKKDKAKKSSKSVKSDKKEKKAKSRKESSTESDGEEEDN